MFVCFDLFDSFAGVVKLAGGNRGPKVVSVELLNDFGGSVVFHPGIAKPFLKL